MKDLAKMCLTAIISLLAVIICCLVCSSCRASHNMEVQKQIDYSGDLQQMQSRMDSLLYNMRLMSKEISEKVSNLKIENTTTYLSPPDSTGKQYPTQVSETTVNKEEKENKTIDTEINVTMQQLVTEVNELKQKLDAVITDKEKVRELSWWDLHKDKVYYCIIGLFIVKWLVSGLIMK